jgi:uncharacterized lipoprotein YajG
LTNLNLNGIILKRVLTRLKQMKKIIVIASAMLFLAAACNQNQQANQTPPPPPTTASAKVDAAVNALDKNIETEDAINMQSDTDLLSADEEIINSYNGVSNASSY